MMVSDSCMPNIAQIIKLHSQGALSNDNRNSTAKNDERHCDCHKKDECNQFCAESEMTAAKLRRPQTIVRTELLLPDATCPVCKGDLDFCFLQKDRMNWSCSTSGFIGNRFERGSIFLHMFDPCLFAGLGTPSLHAFFLDMACRRVHDRGREAEGNLSGCTAALAP